MKRSLFVIGTILALFGTKGYADATVPASSGTITASSGTAVVVPVAAATPVNAPMIWLDTPFFKGYVPGVQVSVISLFDFINKQPLVGAETTVFSISRIVITAGGVTSISGKGSPYIGGYLTIPNPTPALVFLNDLELGGFGGRDFNANRYIAGLKIGKQIW
jgi:hypothetical protein